ncbi:hypothetical protein [Paenibacillus sp. NPDC055715]
MMRRFQSIHYCLFILFLLSMSGMVLAISLLFYNRITVQFHDKVSELARKNVSQTAGLLELLLSSYNSLSKSISIHVITDTGKVYNSGSAKSEAAGT